MSFNNKTYWLVGASEGLGRSLAEALSAEGATLILSARTESRLKELADTLPGPAQVLPLDVTSDSAVTEAGQSIGRIDGVIYAAGVYNPMSAADWRSDQVAQMIDINFAGAARVAGAVVNQFTARNEGHIVFIGSLSGFRGLPGAIGYGASKAGMMHLAENLQADLHRTGVKIQLVNPGFIRTRLTSKNSFTMPFIMEPEEAASHVIRAMKSDRFQSNFPRVFSWLFRASNFLPAPLYYRLFGAGAISEAQPDTRQPAE